MWKYAILVLTLGFFSDLSAQEPCGAPHYLEQLETAYPGFAAATDQVYRRVSQQQGQARDFELVTIPVVVHIVYQDETQNLPDSLITAVLEVLNQDYRRLNADADQVRDEFLPVVDDAFIQFELAGVERVSTTSTFSLDIFGGGLPDNVKRTAEGGSDAWDPEQHLNIWVCNIEGGALLGYAYPPADLDNWPEGTSAPSPELDGVVVHYEVFRRTGTFTTTGLLGLGEVTIPVRGRTITHEVGHYLGLRHIWGDGTLAILGIPDCTADDGVLDTPNQGLSSQFNCDPTSNGCSDGPDDLPDMWENYMDYSEETCQNSFTFGQIEIMRSVLANERAALVAGSVDVTDLTTTNLRIYPNPTTGLLRLPVLDLEKIEVYDAQGQLVRTIRSNNGNLDLADATAGLYFLKLYAADGLYSARVVKQ